MCKYREPARFCHFEPLGEESCFTELHFVLFEILRFAQDDIAFMLCGAFTERSRPFRKITVKFAGRRVVAPYKRNKNYSTFTDATIVCCCVPPPTNSPRLMPQSPKSRP